MNIFLPEHNEILRAFNQHSVDYLLIGGYAVIIHGYGRTTGDMDIWLRPSNVNKKKVIDSFAAIGFSGENLTTLNHFDFTEMVMFFLGIEPHKMEFMTRVSLVEFDGAFKRRLICQIEEDFEVPVINYQDLILTKMNTGRIKDQADIEELQRIAKLKQ